MPVRQFRILERYHPYVDAPAERVVEVRGKRRVRLERNEWLGAELNQAPSRLAGTGSHLEYPRPRVEPAAFDQDLVDTRRVPRPSGVVRGRVEPEELSPFLAADALTAHQGGGLCTQRPPTIVATTSTDSSSS